MLVNVVPLRRLSADHDWFTYELPDEVLVPIGSLVEVPFGRQQIRGIVWEPASQAPAHLKKVTRPLIPSTVVSPWLRLLASLVAQTYQVSLASILQTALPTFPKKITDDWIPARQQSAVSKPDPQTLWYRDRKFALEALENWISQSPTRPTLAVFPTIETATEAYNRLAKKYSPTLVTSQLPPAAIRKIYRGILTGSIQTVIGTVSGLWLPWPSFPSLWVDQEEHPGHKQLRQHPRLHLPSLLASLPTDQTVTTPAPSVSWYHLHQPPSPPPAGQRMLWRLDQPLVHPWITAEFGDALQRATPRQPIFCILPRHGDAHLFRCPECSFILRCKHCQTIARITNQQSPQTCQICRQPIAVPTVCPNCQSPKFGPSGLSRTTFFQQLASRYPELTVQSTWPADQEFALGIGTYQDVRHLQNDRDWQAGVFVSGDSLRSWPDFSADERAWQYTARVASQLPATPIAIQTYNHQDVFWQRWVTHNDQAWYAHELSLRTTLALPPMVDSWIMTYPGPAPEQAVSVALQALEKFTARITVRRLPREVGQRSERLWIAAKGIQTVTEILPATLFPFPWQRDPHVTSWLT